MLSIFVCNDMLSSDEDTGPVAGCRSWSIKCHQAYGICLSLYEQHPVSMKMSGQFFHSLIVNGCTTWIPIGIGVDITVSVQLKEKEVTTYSKPLY